VSGKVHWRPPGVLEIRVSANPVPWSLGFIAAIAFTFLGDVWLGLIAAGVTGWMVWGQRASVITVDRDRGRLRVVAQGFLGGPWGAIFREVPLEGVERFRVIQTAQEHVDGFGLHAILTSGEDVELCGGVLSFSEVHAWEAHVRELLGPTVRVEAVG
jgi:hypothetical protein